MTQPGATPTEPQRCDVIVNNGFGEPTECGRSWPCEYHSPSVTEPQVRGTARNPHAERIRFEFDDLGEYGSPKRMFAMLDAALDWERRRTVEPLRALVTFLEYELPYWGDMPGQQERHHIYVDLLHRARAALDPATPGEEDPA